LSWQDWGERGARPIRVEGGLVARSERGSIGSTWWSRRFVAVLESLSMGGRLTRGRTYARKGQVLRLAVRPGAVSSTVQGSRPEPYQVSIGLRVLDDDAWQAVESALASQALYRAQLLAGELPGELEEVFAAAGAPLFPRTARELSMRCTCPDAAVPCKHIAATFYLLAERFDDDPFELLLWRGRSREELLADLAAGATEDAPDAAQPVGALRVLGDLPSVDLAAVTDRFWVPPVPLPARPPTLEAPVDLLVRQLPDPPPALGGRPTLEALGALYLALAGDEGSLASDPSSPASEASSGYDASSAER
jgi:uncharacterized Zn finger protein